LKVEFIGHLQILIGYW